MKQFLKEHSYDAVKLLVTQCAISMFGFVLTLACGMIESNALRTGCSIFAVVFYLFLVYTSIWELGAKDGLSAQYGHKEYRPLTGFWIAHTIQSGHNLFFQLILIFWIYDTSATISAF